MKWKAKSKSENLINGSTRTITRFHMLPHYYFGWWVWLEAVELLQEYSTYEGWETIAIIH